MEHSLAAVTKNSFTILGRSTEKWHRMLKSCSPFKVEGIITRLVRF